MIGAEWRAEVPPQRQKIGWITAKLEDFDNVTRTASSNAKNGMKKIKFSDNTTATKTTAITVTAAGLLDIAMGLWLLRGRTDWDHFACLPACLLLRVWRLLLPGARSQTAQPHCAPTSVPMGAEWRWQSGLCSTNVAVCIRLL